MKYRKKPVVIEAVQWNGENHDEIADFMGEFRIPVFSRCFEIQTLEGSMTAIPGDWIIKGIRGEFYPCKPDIFAATYEPAERGEGA